MSDNFEIALDVLLQSHIGKAFDDSRSAEAAADAFVRMHTRAFVVIISSFYSSLISTVEDESKLDMSRSVSKMIKEIVDHALLSMEKDGGDIITKTIASRKQDKKNG